MSNETRQANHHQPAHYAPLPAEVHWQRYLPFPILRINTSIVDNLDSTKCNHFNKRRRPMKKIGFNEHYCLQTAVFYGTKTMTRRTEKCLDQLYSAEKHLGKPLEIYQQEITREGIMLRTNAGILSLHTRYKIDEEVAVAQAYKEIGLDPMRREPMFLKTATLIPEITSQPLLGWHKVPLKYHKGYDNKMFTCAALKPNRIIITGIKVERLQDISEKDCLKEGITTMTEGNFEVGNAFGWDTDIDALKRESFFTPRVAFAALIDKPGVGGKGTWQRNPWVFAYSFKLVK